MKVLFKLSDDGSPGFAFRFLVVNLTLAFPDELDLFPFGFAL